MKIIICGDSFVTPVAHHPGTHFSEIMQKKLNCEIMYLGRGGMSNGGICLQLEAAMQQSPDLILFNTSFIDRVEFSTTDRDDKKLFSIRDVHYSHEESVTSYTEISQNPSLIVDNLNSLLQVNLDIHHERWNRLYQDLPDFQNKRSALKVWFDQIYTPAWKRQIDIWCMEAVTRRMIDRQIPFVMFLDVLGINVFPWFNHVNNISDSVILRFYQKFVDISVDPGYHTTYETQEKIATYVLAHLKRFDLVR